MTLRGELHASASSSMANSAFQRQQPLYILTGQTASGKAAVGLSLVERVGAEIISLDSMKLYRGLDIGVAKPSAEKRKLCRFHMIDVAEASQTFSLSEYLAGAKAAVADITARGKKALFVGGTPLYLRGLLYGIFDGPGANWELRRQLADQAESLGPEALHDKLRLLDPLAAERLHPNDTRRVVRALEVVEGSGKALSEHQRQWPAPQPAVPNRIVAFRRTEEDLRLRIRRRIECMFEAGIVDEVKRALDKGGLNRSLEKAIGYKETLMHLRGELTLPETIEFACRNTWRLARKQRGWMKSFPDVQWVDVQPDEPAAETAARVERLLFGAPDGMN